ncbi:MAG: ribonuclease H-like domain-containing protein [Candidatus Obscuribacterales bacterium]|nr:ribonuclease H-like domain-containing protein [Candidatus Obscuribacterales bacterium]
MKTDLLVKHRKPELFEGDLPDDRLRHYLTKKVIAIDTETRGLILRRDRLCLVQICDDEGVVSFVRYKDKSLFDPSLPSNVKTLCHAENVIKLFHYARFDVSVLKYYLGIDVNPIFCTKIASKLVRTYTDKHSLKELTRELLAIELDKSDQTSDWAQPHLTESQLEYAANDVRMLLPIYQIIVELLEREERTDVHAELCRALPTICELDRLGYRDIFEH